MSERIVLEEVFETRIDEEGKDYQFKMGEIVIFVSQLDPQQMIVCKTWKKEYKDKLKEYGIDVDA